jgi:hypothetical protein
MIFLMSPGDGIQLAGIGRPVARTALKSAYLLIYIITARGEKE